MFDFPNSPTTNQVATFPDGSTRRWDGTKWVSIPASYQGVGEAPADGQLYGRTGSNQSWNPAAPINNPTFTGTVTAPTVNIDGGTIDGTDLGDTTPAAATVTSMNGGQLAGFRNAIINGAMDVWQRGSSFSNPASGTYNADRWYFVYDGTGSTFTINRVAFANTTQILLDAGFTNLWQYACTVAGSGGTQKYTGQRIENVRTMSGRTITVSFYANADAARSISVNWQQYFGTGGSPSANANGTPQAITIQNTWARYSVTFTLPSITNKTIGTNGDSFLFIFFNLPLNTTCTINITGVQVEPGPLATPFEWRPFQTEVVNCQRYFQAGAIQYWGVASAASQAIGATINFLTTPRSTTAAITWFNQTYTNCSGLTGGQYGSGISYYATSSASGIVSFTAQYLCNAEL